MGPATTNAGQLEWGRTRCDASWVDRARGLWVVSCAACAVRPRLGVACTRVRSGAGLRVPAVASTRGPAGYPSHVGDVVVGAAHAGPAGRSRPEEGRKLLHSAHARTGAGATWERWR